MISYFRKSMYAKRKITILNKITAKLQLSGLMFHGCNPGKWCIIEKILCFEMKKISKISFV